MAAKSDFAQKLLYDLRLRKERMATSQSSSHSNSMARDSYRNPGQTNRGSRQIKAPESIGGPKTRNQRPMSSGGSRSMNTKESSQQMVSYGGGRHGRSDSIADLSMAFAYALKNGGTLTNMDFSGSTNNNTMINFLHQIGRRSLDKHRPSNGGFPTLTNIQINEISKGVQNLNRILKSSSSSFDMNFDGYSMEVGKELLKGAKGLEESLRMLVNLQEASEYMISPQRKSRVTLLEVDEDDEDNSLKIIDQKQVALPRFSFDKPSKKSQLAPTNTTDSSKLVTHRRSVSCGTDNIRSLSTVSGTKNSSNCSVPSKTEKGRISNVIAKLMGLEEIPVKLDSQSTRKESSSRQNNGTMVMKSSYTSSPMNAESRTGDGEKQVNKISPTKDLVLFKDEKPQVKKTIVVKKQGNTNRSNQLHEKHNNRQDKKREMQKCIEQSETKEEKIQQKRRSPEVAVNTRQERVDKKKTIRLEESNEIRLIPGNGQKQQTRKGTQKIQQELKPKVSSKPMPEETSIKKGFLLKEPPIQASKGSLKAKGSIKNLTDGNINKKVSPREQEFEAETKDSYVQPPPVQEKAIHLPITPKKIDSEAVHRSEIPRKRDEVLKKRNGTPNNLGRQSKHKLSIMQEVKQGRHATKRKEVQQLDSIRSKGVEISKESNENQSNTKQISREIQIQDESERSATLKTEAADESSQNTTFDNLKDEALVPAWRNDIERTCEESLDINYLPQNKHKKAFYSGTLAVLTEPEKQLKEILIKDQLFLNTAEALFKLNIPVGILHVDDHNHHGTENKLKLACGCEILRRKARSQELSVHPYMKTYSSNTAIKYLDDLVKQLYKDFESLRLYGTNALEEFDEADYLHHMLERDIQNKDPDINSFWDFGWNKTTFAFVEKDEFTKNVEQYVLNWLIDEITEDFLTMSSSY